MSKAANTEIWKEVSFDFKYIGKYGLQVSNPGNRKAFNKFSAGEPLQGSTINGYQWKALRTNQK